MKKRKRPLFITAFMFILLLMNSAIMIAGEKVEEALTKRLDTAGMSGISLWIGNLYNDERWLFAIFCTVCMAALGIIIAFVTDRILKLFGLEVSKIAHHE